MAGGGGPPTAVVGASLPRSQFIICFSLVCSLFFLWGLSYGLLDSLNKKFQDEFGITKAESTGLQAAYFAFNGISAFAGPLIASRYFFSGSHQGNLNSVQYVYLAVGLFGWALAVLFWLAPFPEVKQDVSPEQEAFVREQGYSSLFKRPRLMFGFVAEFLYVGAQVAVASLAINYFNETTNVSTAQAANLFSYCQMAFMAGRFLSVPILHVMHPTFVLGVYGLCAMIFAILVSQISGTAGAAMLFMVFAFESICYPVIYAEATLGLGPFAAKGGAFIAAGVAGGAWYPSVQAVIADARTTQLSYAFSALGFFAVSAYGFGLWIVSCRVNGFHIHRLKPMQDEAIKPEELRHDHVVSEHSQVDKSDQDFVEKGATSVDLAMSEAPRKQEKDFTKECDEVIPNAESLAESGKVQDALDKLLVLEKQTRNAADLASTSRILVSAVSLTYKAKDYARLNEYIQVLSKKHGQLRQAVQKMVDEAMSYLDALEGKTKLDLIETLREVTEGKIYLEVPRARVTRMLSNIKEKEGDINQASELLQELQVETFGSMERREKVDFILEQMRLLKLQGEWDKMGIVSKRINIKWLSDKENEDLKLRYYALMILWGLHGSKYLEVCKFYRAVYETPSIQEDDAKWSSVLRNIVYFVVLAPYDNEQSDLLERVFKDEKLVKVPESYDLIKCFTTPELMRWPGVEELYGQSLRQTKVFGSKGVSGVAGDIEESDKDSQGDKRWQVLHDRVVEHNIRVISKYYTRVTVTRLSELLDLDQNKTESFLSSLVSSKTVYAKIDRPAGTVSFEQPKTGDQILNDWSSDVSKLMGLIDKTCHLIAKEHAVNAALKAQQSSKA
ncbi:proteasome regulatory particle subunit [Microbotryomycetes sp. JL221]|nr:proteasome regulatory particle subunit [Microbotryomycetes sp. JL221]